MSGARTQAKGAFSVTLVRDTSNGGKLCKVHEYDADKDQVKSRPAAKLYTGTATTRSFSSMSEFIEFRAGLDENEALVMGHPIYPDAKIVTQAELGRIPSVPVERHPPSA